MNFNATTDHATITTNSRKRVNLPAVPLPKLLGSLLGGEGPPLTPKKLSLGSVPAREATSHTLPPECVIKLLAARSPLLPAASSATVSLLFAEGPETKGLQMFLCSDTHAPV